MPTSHNRSDAIDLGWSDIYYLLRVSVIFGEAMMESGERSDSQSQNELNNNIGNWILRKAFWDGFFMGFFPTFYSVSIRSDLSDRLYKPNAYAEDQRRVGRDMRIAINSVSNELENYHR